MFIFFSQNLLQTFEFFLQSYGVKFHARLKAKVLQVTEHYEFEKIPSDC